MPRRVKWLKPADEQLIRASLQGWIFGWLKARAMGKKLPLCGLSATLYQHVIAPVLEDAYDSGYKAGRDDGCRARRWYVGGQARCGMKACGQPIIGLEELTCKLPDGHAGDCKTEAEAKPRKLSAATQAALSITDSAKKIADEVADKLENVRVNLLAGNSIYTQFDTIADYCADIARLTRLARDVLNVIEGDGEIPF